MAELRFDIDWSRDGFALAMHETLPLAGITAISGPSGAGKTSLLRVLAGLEPEARANVVCAGADWSDLPPDARRVGMVFQDMRLFPHLSVAENIAYGARRRGVSVKRQAEIIAALGLEPLLRRAPADLSGGEARRVALARAMASDPALLMLDEPLAGLDAARKRAVLPYIAGAADKFRLPILMVSHDAIEIAALAERVLLVEGGTITGWQAPPVRLTAMALGGGRFRLSDGQELAMPGVGPARAGDEGDIRPLGPLVLSEGAPGATSALAVIEADVAAVPAPGQVTLAIGRQLLTIPSGAAKFTPGTRLHLSLSDVFWRPGAP